MFKKVIMPIILFSLISGCASTQPDKNVVSIEEDPRIGPELRNVCSAHTIRGWNHVDNDKDALIVTLSQKKQYKLSLMGSCDADWAMTKIAVVRKGSSSCIYKGDKVVTDSQMSHGMSCLITKIERWYPEKLENKNAQKSAEKVDNDK